MAVGDDQLIAKPQVFTGRQPQLLRSLERQADSHHDLADENPGLGDAGSRTINQGNRHRFHPPINRAMQRDPASRLSVHALIILRQSLGENRAFRAKFAQRNVIEKFTWDAPEQAGVE